MIENSEAKVIAIKWLNDKGLAKRLEVLNGRFITSSDYWQMKVVKRLNKKAVVGTIDVDFLTGEIIKVSDGIYGLIR